MPLVVNSVCRFTFEGTYIDRPWVNILDMQLDTTGQGSSRDDFIFDTAGNCINAWCEHLPAEVSSAVQLNSVSWVDLNSLAGSTGQRVATSEHTLPVAGTATGASTSGNISVLVTKQVVASRGRRNGRWYQVGVTEIATDGNTLNPGTTANFQAAFDAFLSELNDTGGGDLLTRRAVVVHTTGPNPQTGTYSPINQFVVSNRLATQRRRLRG